MNTTSFRRLNTIVAWIVFAISAFTYLLTIEPTLSFWDCGEFIASSYKLEIGHPPGNPVFQIIARFFTMFGGKESAAMLVNSMSAIASAFTIFFLYLTIVHLCRRLLGGSEDKNGQSNISETIKIIGAGVVGSLAYCWSDTFWFSAVEGEVYAMSSLVTAIVFWAMLKWEEQAEEEYSNRWIVFIAFLMGLSIGIHLLNLLTIPALGLVYYYRKSGEKSTTIGAIKAFLISCVILAFILWGIIPYVPLISAYFDLFFVNKLHMPINSGAAFFVLAIIVACFVGIYITFKKGKVLRNTIYLCLLSIMIGYTLFAAVVIRSSVNTPTNEYQPDNPFTLVRYLGREQYGSAPLLYGQTYETPMSDIKNSTYYNIIDGKYELLNKPAEPEYSSGKVFFPRMYSSGSGNSYVDFYKIYTDGGGYSAKANLKYFFGYQLDFMYWRYFMWNFAGRQNDLHSSAPGDIYKGNWESGIGFIDRARLGDQSEGPDYVVNSRAKNHFFFLPLILGIIGLIYQYKKDRRNFIIVLLLFFMTGIAIVLYLNQPPFQPRERDYAYAGSFYFFTVWIGLSVLWLSDICAKIFKKESALTAVVASVVALLIPIQMVSQTWDDHDRSGRYTCRDMAYNLLNNVDEQAILVTHGDNDTFPLWYLQEVEGVRTDVRIVNTSLLSIDWYIDQMQYKQYESEPLKFSLTKRDYYYGNNDFIPVYNQIKEPILASSAMELFKRKDLNIKMQDNLDHGVIFSSQLQIPVNKENALKFGIVSEKDADKILDTVVLNIGEGSISKTDLMLLDLLSNYQWDRPVYFMQKGGDVSIGIKDYLQYDGLVYKFVPIKSITGKDYTEFDSWQKDSDILYEKAMNTFRLASLSDNVNIDYQNLLTFSSLVPMRDFMSKTARALANEGKTEQALEVLDRMQETIPEKNFPLNTSLISSTGDLATMDAVETYLRCGAKEKGVELGNKFEKETLDHIALLMQPYQGYIFSEETLSRNIYYLLMLAEVYRNNDAVAEGAALRDRAEKLVNMFNSRD